MHHFSHLKKTIHSLSKLYAIGSRSGLLPFSVSYENDLGTSGAPS